MLDCRAVREAHDIGRDGQVRGRTRDARGP